MRILWFTWKDKRNPLAGGAEVVNEELAKRLVADGHEVILIVGGFTGGQREETVNGYRIIRLGNRYTVYLHAWRYYRKHLRGWADLVIDEMNTMPFFAKFYVKEPNILLAYQLCRRVWFYELPLPLSLIGYLIEPIYLWLLRDRRVITESNSAKDNMIRFGFKAANISIISIGLERPPVPDITSLAKFSQPTLLSVGAMRAMKNTLDQIKAFEIAKLTIPNLQLKIIGDSSSSYGQKVLKYIARSPYSSDIEYLGRTSLEQKIETMQKSHLIMVTSIKEGWGLIVTEAASQGTPAVVYDVDGLRDAVRHQQTGLITAQNTPEALAQTAVDLLQDPDHYNQLRTNAWEWSKEMTFERSHQEFIKVVTSIKQRI